MKNITPIFLLIFAACTQAPKEESPVVQEDVINQEVNDDHHSETLKKVFEAHGGYDNWASMAQLSFKLGDETHLTNIKSRKTLITSPKQTIGFDGADVWITPDSVDASRARFYHNLFFYFYSMPFVIGDPGAKYEDVEAKELSGKTYAGVRVSFGEGIGDSPKDYYIVWYDPETYRMEWLMYTVTYGKSEVSESYNLIRYNNWGEFSGAILPTSLQWYKYDGEQVGEMRSERAFTEISLSSDEPSDEMFLMPEDAQISPAPEGSGD